MLQHESKSEEDREQVGSFPPPDRERNRKELEAEIELALQDFLKETFAEVESSALQEQREGPDARNPFDDQIFIPHDSLRLHRRRLPSIVDEFPDHFCEAGSNIVDGANSVGSSTVSSDELDEFSEGEEDDDEIDHRKEREDNIHFLPGNDQDKEVDMVTHEQNSLGASRLLMQAGTAGTSTRTTEEAASGEKKLRKKEDTSNPSHGDSKKHEKKNYLSCPQPVSDAQHNARGKFDAAAAAEVEKTDMTQGFSKVGTTSSPPLYLQEQERNHQNHAPAAGTAAGRDQGSTIESIEDNEKLSSGPRPDITVAEGRRLRRNQSNKETLSRAA